MPHNVTDLQNRGAFACCTQNVNPCGGLRGALRKHLLVLIVGLAKNGQLDPQTAATWAVASNACKPDLDKDVMSEALLKYKGAEAGEVDGVPSRRFRKTITRSESDGDCHRHTPRTVVTSVRRAG